MDTTGSGFLGGGEERIRVSALAALRLLDTPPEKDFDQVVQLAADLCDAPVSLLSLLDAERQFHKAHFGTALREVPRNLGFCRYTVQQCDLYVVADAAADTRFADNPLVHGAPGIRFYAGVPLFAGPSIAVGALSVIDTVPRSLTAQQSRTLRVLGHQVSAQFQLRAHVSATENLAAELNSERELFRHVLDGMPFEVCLKSDAGTTLFYNRRISERFGLLDGEWLGKTADDLLPPDQAEQLRREQQIVLQSNLPSETYTEQIADDGARSFWKVIQTPLQRPSGERLLAKVSLDLTPELRREAALQQSRDDLEEANRKLRSLSLTDDLTGLWNRRAFDAQLETELHRTHQSSAPLSLLMIDVDDFKQLNDAHGHSHGDLVLKQLAGALQRTIRDQDKAARIGGEEFAVILPNSPLQAAKSVCHRLSQELKLVPWMHRPVTISIGIALLLPNSRADELLDMADIAMYRAKHSGKNCAVAYEAETTPPAAPQAG